MGGETSFPTLPTRSTVRSWSKCNAGSLAGTNHPLAEVDESKHSVVLWFVGFSNAGRGRSDAASPSALSGGRLQQRPCCLSLLGVLAGSFVPHHFRYNTVAMLIF